MILQDIFFEKTDSNYKYYFTTQKAIKQSLFHKCFILLCNILFKRIFLKTYERISIQKEIDC